MPTPASASATASPHASPAALSKAMARRIVAVLNGDLQFLLSPVMGALSDRIGRIRIMLTTSIVETSIHLTGDKLAPGYYVLIAAVLSGLSLVVVARRMRSASDAVCAARLSGQLQAGFETLPVGSIPSR